MTATDAARTFRDAARYLLDSGWIRDGQDAGLWLDPVQSPSRTWMDVGEALIVQWERDGVSMLSTVEATSSASEAAVGIVDDHKRLVALVGGFEEALRAARASHLGDERIANEMANHFPVEIRCDHERGMDKVFCDCGIVDLGWHPSVRRAKDVWAAHVIDVVKGARAALAGGTPQPQEDV